VAVIRRARLSSVAAAAAVVVTTLGVSAGPASAHDNDSRRLPDHVFAPYVEAYTSDSPAALSKASGAKYLTFAFLQTSAPGSCDISWNGDPSTPVAWSTYGSDIAQIRAHGGDVVPSFGGYSADSGGEEIADSCTDVHKIAAAYEKVITTYGVTRLDMDVEDVSLFNKPAIDRRNEAIAEVERWAHDHGRLVQFVYTLPTNVDGMDDTPDGGGVYVVRSAAAHHARIDIVNIMTFDYYDGNTHEMAADTKTAANHLVSTLHAIYPHRSTNELWRMVGITEMIGRDDYGSDPANDTGPKEIFTLADAKNVTDWASDHHIGELSFWALQRDKASAPDCSVGTFGGDDCSGIAQSTWEFSHIMEPFTDR
jgi:hypothetical protein